MSQVQQFLSNIDKQFSKVGILDEFESKAKLPRSYAVLGGTSLYGFLVFLNIGGIGQLLSNIAGFVVPGYYSLKALETAGTKDDTELLTYWVVFAFLNVIEFWSKAILYWIPLYWFVKTIFLLWLVLPATKGSAVVYKSVIQPLAQKYVTNNNVSDDLLNKVNEAAKATSTGFEK
ncbi:BA75_02631T0 [Komagataella pastoris]|uniref:Protein YOP1 n=1 Tax=Komagataella pastoris TaxID=4922 RepID=A0A1B2JBN8_PICPA|nr:BA75_02631T0 [Komagataella pastoris]